MSLRQQFDFSESFMTGHQTVGPRTYKRPIPEWAYNDAKIKALLLTAFPKLKTNKRQKHAAERWALVIHLYFRMNYTRSQIAQDLDSTVSRIDSVIRSIYRTANGQRTNGSGARTRAK
jgi:hypothetical protein